MNKNSKFNAHSIAEAGIVLGIVLMLDVLIAYTFRALFPEGWSFQLSYLFIVILAFRRGVSHAIIVNFSRAWIVAAVSGSFFPPTGTYGILMSLSFDYIIGTIFSLLIAQLIVNSIRKSNNWIKLLSFITISLTVSFASSFISGALVWGQYAWDGWGVYLYSFVYNFSSIGASLFITLILAIVLLKTKQDILFVVKYEKDEKWG